MNPATESKFSVLAGVHANAGGDYPKQGLAMISLDWMMSEAEAVRDGTPGLRFIAQAHEAVRRSANPYDKLYNSRTGVSLAYGYDPRDIAALTRKHGFDNPAIQRGCAGSLVSGVAVGRAARVVRLAVDSIRETPYSQ